MKEHDSSSTFLCKILLLKMRYPAFIHVFQTGCPVMIVLKSQFITEIVIVTVRNEVAKVMFLQASVCPQGGGGVCLSACWDTTPPEQTPPKQTPRSRHSPSPQSRHPPGADTPPGADNPPPRDTATAADGTHPAEMHSCKCVFRFFYLTEKWQSCIYY